MIGIIGAMAEEVAQLKEAMEQEAVETANGASVTMKGKDGTFSLAVWESNGYTYSVYADTARTSADLLALVKGIR